MHDFDTASACCARITQKTTPTLRTSPAATVIWRKTVMTFQRTRLTSTPRVLHAVLQNFFRLTRMVVGYTDLARRGELIVDHRSRKIEGV